MAEVIRFVKRWWFSSALLLAYVGVFQFWLLRPQDEVMRSTPFIVVALGTMFVQATSRRYFVNTWDGVAHAAVILDVALEGTWIGWHSDRSFYWCAAAFVLVVGGYRAWQLRRQELAQEL